MGSGLSSEWLQDGGRCLPPAQFPAGAPRGAQHTRGQSPREGSPAAGEGPQPCSAGPQTPLPALGLLRAPLAPSQAATMQGKEEETALFCPKPRNSSSSYFLAAPRCPPQRRLSARAQPPAQRLLLHFTGTGKQKMKSRWNRNVFAAVRSPQGLEGPEQGGHLWSRLAEPALPEPPPGHQLCIHCHPRGWK